MQPPEYPRVIKGGENLYLEVENGSQYRIPETPEKVMGLLDHFTGKSWCTVDFLRWANRRMAAARGWPIHPI